MRLKEAFYSQDTLSAARALIGKRLVRVTQEGRTSGIIVETEAYLGQGDDASHTFRKRSERTRVAYEGTGRAYVYLIYGMHCCFNITTAAPGIPEMVLIRALQPDEGIPLMQRRRGTDDARKLCSGPGKLCAALSIDRSLYGETLWQSEQLFAEETDLHFEVAATPRIHIDSAPLCRDKPWRFIAQDSAWLSVKPRG